MSPSRCFAPLARALILAGLAAAAPAAMAQQPAAPAPQPAPPPQAGQGPATLGERAGDVVRRVTGDPAANADRDMLRVLGALSALNPTPIEGELPAAEARAQPSAADAVRRVLREENRPDAPEPGVTVREISIPGPAGPLRARVYAPQNAAANLPVVVYFHGGGWVIADLDTYDASFRAVSRQAAAAVVAVHYRQGPENRFPAAHDDAFAAYRWVVDNAAQVGGDARRVALMGESAGGNLAVATAMRARDERVQAPAHVVAVYPIAGVDLATPSYQANESAKPLNRAMMEYFFRNYLRNDADRQDPRIDLVGRANLQGLPPTTVITAAIDPLRTEGQALTDRLRQAGVAVEARDYEGVTHEFFGMGAVVADARAAQAFASQRLVGAFGR